MSFFRRWYSYWATLILCVFLFTFEIQAQNIDDALDRVVRDAVNGAVGVTVTFSSNRSISGGSFALDDDEDTDIEVYKIPATWKLGKSESQVQPFIQLLVGYFGSDSSGGGSFEPADSVDFDTYSAGLTSGVTIGILGEQLSIEPSLGLFYSRVELDYDANSVQTMELLQPFIEEGLLNFDLDTYTIAPGIVGRYSQELSSDLKLLFLSDYTYLQTGSTSSDPVARGFSASTSVLRNRMDVEINSHMQVKRRSLWIKPYFGRTELFGDTQDSLGVNYFYELGLDLIARSTSETSLFRDIGIGFGYVDGDNINGWRVDVVYELE